MVMMVKKAFQVNKADNVATLLDNAGMGQIAVHGCGQDLVLNVVEPIALGHKVAIAAIPCGAQVIKFGVPIGVAAIDIAPGEWVHLHNCRSQVDERSSHLDLQTGAATDTPYA